MQNHLISAKIIDWYKLNARDLPWRQTNDPYKIWLSEIILQQTRVAQGLPYYHKFIDKFPNINALALASEDEILLNWQGLGYYSRARNLHACAKIIVNNYQGKFPSSYSDLLKLPGIGDYTAAAIASFAYQLPHPAIDGNIIRVMSRLFGIFEQPHSPESKKMILQTSNLLLSNSEPDIYNQAMMEFGAMLCGPTNPNCGECPVNIYCYAFENKIVAELPLAKKKVEIKVRFFYFIILKLNDKILLEKRTNKDIWLNLFQFPLIEDQTEINLENLLPRIKNKLSLKNLIIENISEVIEHKLTHRILKAQFIHIEIAENFDLVNLAAEPELIYNANMNFNWVSEAELDCYAMPQLLVDYRRKNNL
jgi:A/G-specific adenine glycosylase